MPGSVDGLKLAHAARDRWPRIKSLSYRRGSAAAVQTSFQQLLCRETISGGGNGRGIAFAGGFSAIVVRNTRVCGTET
jgi:hypothetical protein